MPAPSKRIGGAMIVMAVSVALTACGQIVSETFTNVGETLDSPAAPASSWEALPSASAEPYPVTGSAEAPEELTMGEPLELEGFLYEVVDARRWDRSADDDGWCLAVLIHEETPDPDATDPLAGWSLRDETGRDYAFDFTCQDGTAVPERPHVLAADELQAGMAEGHRYWISFDVLDESVHLWLVRSREVDGDPAIALQLS